MSTISPVNQRVKELMEALGQPKVDPFVKKYFGEDTRSERLRSAIRAGTGLKTDFLVEITEKIKEVDDRKVNGHWLLTGEGEMFLNEDVRSNTRELDEILKDLDAFRTLAVQNAQTILNLSGGGRPKAAQEA